MRRLLSELNMLNIWDQEGGEEVIAAAASVVVVAVLSCARDQQYTLHCEAVINFVTYYTEQNITLERQSTKGTLLGK